MAIVAIESRPQIVPEVQFFIHIDPSQTLPSRRLLTPGEIRADWQKLQSLKNPWAFLIGALTNKIDFLLGRLPDPYINTLYGIKRYCNEQGINIHDCFSREDHGAATIPAKDATELDGYAIRNCDFLIAAPGFADSRNTASEILLAAQKSKPIIFLLDKNKPEEGEEEFMGWATSRVATSKSAVQSVTITFKDIEEMFSDLGIVLAKYKQEIPIRAVAVPIAQ